MLLKDCGRASKVTQGQINAFWYELGFAPYNRNVCYIPPPGQGLPQCDMGDEPDDPTDLADFKAGVDLSN